MDSAGGAEAPKAPPLNPPLGLQKFLCFFFVFFFFCVLVLFFYFIKISKFALPGVMLMYERTSIEKERKGFRVE